MPTDMKPRLLRSHAKHSPDFVYFDDKEWGIENKIYYNSDFHETKHLTLLDETNCLEKWKYLHLINELLPFGFCFT